MAGRTFPLPNPYRSFPIVPVSYGESYRIEPLPFSEGVGSVINIESTFDVLIYLYLTISIISDPTKETGFITVTSCSQIVNEYCVPIATIELEAQPSAEIRCAIT